MCIYCGTNKYRKIYESHLGPIPKDADGRSYDIHHIDGNRSNNNLNNLVAVSLHEHYDIHYKQKDFGACFLIGKKIGRTPEELSEYFSKLATKTANRLVSDGLHNFQGSRNPIHDKIAKGIQQRISREQNLKRVNDGTHHFLGGDIQRKRVENGTHNFLGGDIQQKTMSRRHSEDPTLRQRLTNYMKQQAEAGSHPFQLNNPNQIKLTCPHCNKTGSQPGMIRWHFSKCKLAP